MKEKVFCKNSKYKERFSKVNKIIKHLFEGGKYYYIEDFVCNDSYLNLTRTQLIKLLCSHLCVSVSRFYKYINNSHVKTTKKIKDDLIEEYISNQQNRQFRKSKSKFKKITYHQMTLLINKSKQFENSINHKRIYRLVKKENMLSKYKQKNSYKDIPR